MTQLEKLIQACKDDIQLARNHREEAISQQRIQNAVIEALLQELSRLEDADRKSKELVQAK